MEENEFIPHQGSSDKETKSNREKKPRTKEQTTEKSKKSTGGFLSSVKNFDWKKVRVVVGTLVLVFSLFLLICCISYFMTWQLDQDKIIGKSFFEFMFQSNMEPWRIGWEDLEPGQRIFSSITYLEFLQLVCHLFSFY